MSSLYPHNFVCSLLTDFWYPLCPLGAAGTCLSVGPIQSSNDIFNSAFYSQCRTSITFSHNVSLMTSLNIISSDVTPKLYIHALASPQLLQSQHIPTAFSQYLDVTQEGAVLTIISPRGRKQKTASRDSRLVRAGDLRELSQSWEEDINSTTEGGLVGKWKGGSGGVGGGRW